MYYFVHLNPFAYNDHPNNFTNVGRLQPFGILVIDYQNIIYFKSKKVYKFCLLVRRNLFLSCMFIKVMMVLCFSFLVMYLRRMPRRRQTPHCQPLDFPVEKSPPL